MFKKFSSVVLIPFFTLVLASVTEARAKSQYTILKKGEMKEDLVLPLERVKFEVDGEKAKLDYALPKELDGTNPKRFVLSGSKTDGEWRLKTENFKVFGVCVGDSKNFSCNMNYDTDQEGIFKLDLESAAEYLETLELPASRVSEIKLGQMAFQHEPVGHISSKSE